MHAQQLAGVFIFACDYWTVFNDKEQAIYVLDRCSKVEAESQRLCDAIISLRDINLITRPSTME